MRRLFDAARTRLSLLVAGRAADLQGGWTGRRGVAGLVTVAALMLLIGILSALRPAIGALRIQPTEALRSE